ncbi:MAG: hypothetical protein M3348_12530, partial [Acidobacteriota bacterium]|nr:hypothetical protein [Acidobacteriota bacterium]
NHLIYVGAKGRNASNIDQWGIFTCPDSTPTMCTADPANPKLTIAAVQAALTAPTLHDVQVSEITFNPTLNKWVYYFFATDGGIGFPITSWQVGYATSTTLGGALSVHAGPMDGFPVNTDQDVIVNSVFKNPLASSFTALVRESATTIDANPESYAGMYVWTSPDGITKWEKVYGAGQVFGRVAGTYRAQGTHTAKILKDPSDPYNLAPLLVGGGYQIYVSGIDATGQYTQGGMIPVTPGAARTPSAVGLPCDPLNPPLTFYGLYGSIANAAITCHSTSAGVDSMVVGLNFAVKADGTFYRFNPAKPYGALVLQPGSFLFTRTTTGGGSSFAPVVSDNNGVTVNGVAGTAGGLGIDTAQLNVLRQSDSQGFQLSVDQGTNGFDLRDYQTKGLYLRCQYVQSGTTTTCGLGTSNPNAGANANAYTFTIGDGDKPLAALESRGNITTDGNAVSNLSVYNRTNLLTRITTFRSGADNVGQLSFYTFNNGAGTEALRLVNGVVALPNGVLRLDAVTAPGTNPPAGSTFLFMDSADGKTKLKKSDGTVTVLN